MLTIRLALTLYKLSQARLAFVGEEMQVDCRLAPPDRSEEQVELTNGDNGQFRPVKQTEGGYGTMDKIIGMFVKAREFQKGQTMAEYALIMAAVAVVVFVGYQTMGTTITTLLTTVDGKL